MMICSREDLTDWLVELLPDPFDYIGKTGSSYGEEIRHLEYVSRPLWAIFSLLCSGEYDERIVEPWIERIRVGLRPGELSFPYPTIKTRQICVEMGVYGFGLLSCGKSLLDRFSEEETRSLERWLNAINDIDLPWGNWYLFRIMVNYGLRQNGLSFSSKRIESDCRAVESMYVSDGWFEDGKPFQRDYYVAIVFHLYALLIDRFVPDHALKDVIARSQAFEEDFICWSDSQGRSIPFGRSLTYRFAHIGYWAAATLAKANTHDISEIKQMTLANLSFWSEQPITQDGVLSIGFGYPNILVAEDYTAPGAPFWGFKAFLLLAFDGESQFWQTKPTAPAISERRAQPAPGLLIQRGERDCFALSVMQYSAGSVLQRMGKYGKFCYSTAFGWNLSRDVDGIANFGVDSSLALSIAHTGQFVSRSRIDAWSVCERYAYSMWSYRDLVRVETWLVPIDARRHVRVHRIEAEYPMETYEGGFPVMGWSSKFDESETGSNSVRIWKMQHAQRTQISEISDAADDPSVIGRILEAAGMPQKPQDGAWCRRSPDIVRQNPNTNVLSSEPSAVPVLRVEIPAGESLFGCLVFGEELFA
ncbi:Uncharacterized conserved protein UCP014753 [Coriobacterium glomerans PW2]|uniref:Uncharacterized conserved protein UCP014753 n=1 Tax=Coriobacterium glomerans (strain ATCC 49209 / DSM 20642 / JCM 10262 / PW2) TaxID=700015 RepID=F2NB29_CORGP|nr:DUF2264 domain-containing protein [Coriobacterium glomerans]AEB07780.1 Uncharacterized conserved protein UCP014753 [Coriobacterium glomerans PW2]